MTAAEFGDERLPERFWSKVRQDPSGCWIWRGSRNSNGYGRFRVAGRKEYAHRVSYAALVGDLPPWTPTGLQCDHLCRNRACVRPEHLELVAPRENLLRGDTLAASHAARTHCPLGHALEGENLVPSALRRGKRECLTCDRAQARAQAAAIRQARTEVGMSRREYVATYGWSAKTAQAILDAIEAATEASLHAEAVPVTDELLDWVASLVAA